MMFIVVGAIILLFIIMMGIMMMPDDQPVDAVPVDSVPPDAVPVVAAPVGPPPSTTKGVYRSITDGSIFVVSGDGKEALKIGGEPTVDAAIGKTFYWAVNKDDSIWRKRKAGGDWERIPGALIKIDANSNGDIWGVNRSNLIYTTKEEPIAWSNVPGALVNISVGTQKTVGINSGNDCYIRPNNVSGPWTHLGKCRGIEAGGGNVYMVEVDGKISYAPESTFPQGKTYIPNTNAKDVTAGGDRVWMITTGNNSLNGNVSACTLPCADGDWKELDAHASIIDLAH
jgi:hypothetical protein